MEKGLRLSPRLAAPTLLLALLAACSPDYSPDTYATRAVQQANKVEQGTIIGRRAIQISADGTTGAATGAAAGGVAGTRVGGGDVTSAFAGIGGGLIGGLLGTAVEKGVGTTPAYEYIVRKGNNELVSVVQKDEIPLDIGEKVLVIAGAQARIVPDYTVPSSTPAAAPQASPGRAGPQAGGLPEGAAPASPKPQEESLPAPVGTPPAEATPAPATPEATPSATPDTPQDTTPRLPVLDQA